MRRARPLLGTIVEVVTSDNDHSDALNMAFECIEELHRLMSFHEPTSDVALLNCAKPYEDLTVNAHTYAVLEFAMHMSRLSHGAFDITVAPVLVHNGFLPGKTGGRADIGANFEDLDLLPGNRVQWRKAGQIDLGGVAKGYAVDCAITALKAAGVASGLVNAGGDLRCFGESQSIHLRHPYAAGQMLAAGWLTEGAVATSAGYFSDDPEKGPLVDPASKRCVTWNGSVSIVADDCMTADALTKVMRLDPERAVDLLESFDAQTIVVDAQGARSCGRPRLKGGA